MIQLKAYKFRLRTSSETATALSRTAGCCRFVWNKALALQKERLNRKESTLSYVKVAALLTQWRHDPEIDFLAEVLCDAQQQKLRDLDRALKDAFNKASAKRFPAFKKRGIRDSFRYPNPKQIKVEGDRIRLPKIGWVRFRKSREIVGELRNATVSKNGNHWYVSIQTRQEIGEPVHPSRSIVGRESSAFRPGRMSKFVVSQAMGR